jgi:hypothetical protein
MGYSTTVGSEPESGTWAVVLKVHPSRAESNDLFLSGDAMVAWPVEGIQLGEDLVLERSSIFVSEVAARPEGLRLRYRERAQAEHAAAVLRAQFGQIGIVEET